jgi:hypothetical protein
MLPANASSPVALALAKVFNLGSQDGSAKLTGRAMRRRVFSYRNEADFNFLWRFGGDTALADEADGAPPSSQEGEIIRWAQSRTEVSEVVIVWDGLPAPSVIGNVDLGHYLTPFDWVVALCLTLRAIGLDAQEDSALRVTIVDLISTRRSHTDSEKLFIGLSLGSPAMVGWVKVYRPSADELGAKSLHKLLVDRYAPAPANERHATTDVRLPRSQDWSLVRRVWSARLLAPGDPRDKHAIANIIGPYHLTSSMTSSSALPSGSNSSCVAALLTLMRALEMFSPGCARAPAPWVESRKWEIDGRPLSAGFVLVDDMCRLGWDRFLQLALGLDGNVSANGTLIFSNGPDTGGFGDDGKVSFLDLLVDEKGELRVNGGINFHNAGKDWVLFLDLRLFTERALEDEMAFFGRLLALARQAGEHEVSGILPWRGFSEQELQAVETCISNREVETDNYFLALTLLPRLTALVAPRLPIILFSSTGQRRITDAMRGYANVIIDFDKPRFFVGRQTDAVNETRERFERAMGRALKFLRGGRVCELFTACPAAPQNARINPYVEIYFDEAEDVADTSFRVGGVVIVYEDEGQARQFNESMVHKGIVWGSTDVEPNPAFRLPKQKLTLSEYQQKIFGPVDSLLGAVKALEIIGFSVAVPPTISWSDSTDLTSPSCLDNLYRGLITQALEVVFFELLPNRLGQTEPHFTCSVHIATRNRHQSIADAPSDWDMSYDGNISRRYGIKVRQDKAGNLYFISVSSDTVYPLVAQVRALSPAPGIKVVTARGSRLFYEVNTSYPESLPRPAHLLADLAVRFATNSLALRKQPSLVRWLSKGFVSTADERFISTLHACRQGRAGRHVEALLGAYKAAGGANAENWARPRLSRSVVALSGHEFAELSFRI